jgi:phospholipid/cholesterol/gamma-HCH transport system substrate-binding protein
MEDAIKEYRELAKAAREAIPDLRRTNDEMHDLARAAKQAIPDFRRTTEEIQVTAKTWSKIGERVDVLLQANQDKLVQTLDNIAEAVRRVASVFNEENQRNVAAIIKNTRAGSENFESISKNADALLKDSRKTVNQLNESLGKTDEILVNVQKASRPLAERSPAILKNLDETTEKLNMLVSEFGGMFRAGGQNDGTLRRLLTDPSLYNNLNDAACMLARMLPRVDRILRDAEVFADKIARHPESLGVSGAVRPSSGLKEAPSSGHPSRNH